MSSPDLKDKTDNKLNNLYEVIKNLDELASKKLLIHGFIEPWFPILFLYLIIIILIITFSNYENVIKMIKDNPSIFSQENKSNINNKITKPIIACRTVFVFFLFSFFHFYLIFYVLIIF